MPVEHDPKRRQFLHGLVAGAGMAMAQPLAAALQQSSADTKKDLRTRTGQSIAGTGTSLLTDPRFQVGAKFRMKQFVQKGADPKQAEAIFSTLRDLDPQAWADAWSRLAQPLETSAAKAENGGDTTKACELYQKASFYYGIAKFPVINHPAKKTAYAKCIDTYLKAAKYFDPPLQRVTIPFEGREIVGYLRLPKGISKPPVVIATGGVDVYKEERDTTDLLDAGLAAFSTDMPGNGESPIWYTANAESYYSAVIDYLVKREDIDGERIGIIGRSYGGYWGAKMAYVESKRLKAAVAWGGPVHYSFQKPWLESLKSDKLYLWSLLDSMIYANHVKDYTELVDQAPTLSLQHQGWLNKPAAPLLTINGAKDGWITIHDLYILLESGDAKAARVYPEGGHMGGDSGADKIAMAWLKAQLEAPSSCRHG